MLRTFSGHEREVTAISLTPDGRRAVSASEDRTLKLWDLETGQRVAEFHAEGGIRCLALRVEPLTIIAGDSLGYLHISRYRVATAECRMVGH